MHRLLVFMVLAACSPRREEPPPGPVRETAPRDVAIDAKPFVMTGPATPEALAAAYIEAFGRNDPDAMRALLITPEINAGLYDCTRRSDYDLVARSRDSMVRSMRSLELRRTIKDNGTIKLGSWEAGKRMEKEQGEISGVCETRLPLTIITGTMEFQLVASPKVSHKLGGAFIVVQANGACLLADASVFELR